MVLVMTGRIAPHEGREIDLVISGDKPLAVIEERKDNAQYVRAMMHRDMPISIYVRFRRDVESGREYIVSQSLFLIHQYLELLKTGVERLGIKGYHRAMGLLFGYSPDDVEAFIDAEIDCNCSKCDGTVVVTRAEREASVRRTMYHA